MSIKPNIPTTIAATLGLVTVPSTAHATVELAKTHSKPASEVTQAAPDAGRLILEKGMSVTAQQLGVLPTTDKSKLGPSTAENQKAFLRQKEIEDTIDSFQAELASWPERIKLFSEKHGMTFDKDYDVKPDPRPSGKHAHTILAQSPAGEGSKTGYSFLMRYNDLPDENREITQIDVFSFDNEGRPVSDGIGGVTTQRTLKGIRLIKAEDGTGWDIGYDNRSEGLQADDSNFNNIDPNEVKALLEYFDNLLPPASPEPQTPPVTPVQ